MLGSLARWLRLFGFDVAYAGPLSDGELREQAESENRLLLTRDKELSNDKRVNAFYVESDVLDEQLRAVMRKFSLEIQNPMSRCSLCNSMIVKVSKSEVKGKVPEGVYEIQDEFWKCPSCGKLYWKGTHWDKILQKIKELSPQDL